MQYLQLPILMCYGSCCNFCKQMLYCNDDNTLIFSHETRTNKKYSKTWKLLSVKKNPFVHKILVKILNKKYAETINLKRFTFTLFALSSSFNSKLVRLWDAFIASSHSWRRWFSRRFCNAFVNSGFSRTLTPLKRQFHVFKLP